MSARRLRRAVVAAAVTVVGLGGGALSALFTSDATATVSVTVAQPVIPRPPSVTCASITSPRAARFTWTAPSPTPTGYRIRMQFASGEFVINPTASPTNITSTTIGSSRYLALVFGETPAVTVNAVYGSYESPNAYSYRLRAVTGGVGCTAAPAGLAMAPVTTTSTTTTTTTSSTSTTTPATTIPATVSPSTTATSTPATTSPATPTTTPPSTTTPTSTTTSTSTSTTSTTTTTTTTTSAPAVTAEPTETGADQ